MKVLYLPILNPDQQAQKEQKFGLRKALARVADTREFDYKMVAARDGVKKMHGFLCEVVEEWQPDVLLAQLHNDRLIPPGIITRLEYLAPDMVRVNFNGDVWRRNLVAKAALELAKAFDLQLTVNQAVLGEYATLGVEADFWDQGWEPLTRALDPDEDTPRYDVLWQGSLYHHDPQRRGRPRRELLGDVLLNLRADGYAVGIYGYGWPAGMAQGQTLYNFKRQGQLTRASRIVIGDQQWPEWPYTSSRLFNILAAGGALVMQQRFKGCGGLEWGLLDGENCILWDTFEELDDFCRYWLDKRREARRARITAAGEQLALERHTFDARVRELFCEILPRHFNNGTEG